MVTSDPFQSTNKNIYQQYLTNINPQPAYTTALNTAMIDNAIARIKSQEINYEEAINPTLLLLEDIWHYPSIKTF